MGKTMSKATIKTGAALAEEVNVQSKVEDVMFETRRYRLTGITPMLGTQPANTAIRTAYIASKAPDELLGAEEQAYFKSEGDKLNGLTLFARDPKVNDRLILLDYMVRGFFKSALVALQEQTGIAAAKSKVDKYLFVFPRCIPITRDGEDILDEDYVFERTLRAETMQGPRTGLSASETIDAPWEIDIELRLLKNRATGKSAALKWEDVELALSYGELCGIGQFRNGSFGRFYWQDVTDEV